MIFFAKSSLIGVGARPLVEFVDMSMVPDEPPNSWQVSTVTIVPAKWN